MAKLHATLAALCLTAALPVVASDAAPMSDEARILVGLIDQQATSLELAKVCVARTSQSELRALCASVLQGQSRIETLQTWLSDWFDVEHMPVVAAQDEQKLARLAAPEGETFETELMTALIVHRLRAVPRCSGGSWRPELLGLCRETVQDYATEVETLRRWMCEWNGACRSEGRHETAVAAAEPRSEPVDPASAVVTPRGD